VFEGWCDADPRFGLIVRGAGEPYLTRAQRMKKEEDVARVKSLR
jgi:hypothetical protein